MGNGATLSTLQTVANNYSKITVQKKLNKSSKYPFFI